MRGLSNLMRRVELIAVTFTAKDAIAESWATVTSMLRLWLSISTVLTTKAHSTRRPWPEDTLIEEPKFY